MELLGPPSKRWESFDAVLYDGVVGFASAELKRQLTNYQQRCFAQRVAPSGRYALWHLLRKYAVSRGTAVQSDMMRLLSHKAAGDLSLYLDGLDNLLLNLDEPATETLLHSLVEPQLRTFKSMEQVFHVYDHSPEGARERTVQFLYDSARTVLQRQAELQQRNDLLGAPVKKVIIAAAPKSGAANAKRKRPPGDKKATGAPYTNAQAVCATFCKDGV